MTNAIKNPPNNYKFGYDFNYALWTEGTKLSLVNVPWNNDYRDVVKFADRAALNTYIDSRETAGVRIENVSYVKPNVPIRVNIPMNAALRFNYLRASNPLQPITGSGKDDVTKDFYYFILGVNYLAPNTTELIVQMDVFQSFIYDCTFGNSYIERGHIGIANTHAFDNYGRDYLTQPEGFDLGGEYRIIAKKKNKIIDRIRIPLGGGVFSDLFSDFHILVATTTDFTADPGDVSNPKLESAQGSAFQYLANGVDFWLWELPSNFASFMNGFKTRPWITQGIISITAIPKITRYYPGFTFGASGFPYYGGKKLNSAQGEPAQPTTDMFTNWRDSTDILNILPARYRSLKKFLTFPYMLIEMTTWTGMPVVLKPESWTNPNATILERATLTPPNQRVSIHPRNYNALPGVAVDADGDDAGEYLDIATMIANFPTFSIVNNGGIAYLAANAHSIAFQSRAAGWEQQRALQGNQTAYDQSSSGISAATGIVDSNNRISQYQTELQNSQSWGQTILNGISSTGKGAAAGAAVGGGAGAAIGAASGLGGAAMSVASTILGTGTATAATQLANSGNSQANAISRKNSEYVRDTNKSLADWAARGDYHNSIAAINAKVQDAALIQPTTAGQLGGETMNLVNGPTEVSLRWKLIDNSAIRAIGDFWLRYGYAVHQFAIIPVTLMAMSKFTYWKLSETYIIAANIPETFKQSIRGIFEKGVTVWANPSDIGTIDIADNTPLGGISL